MTEENSHIGAKLVNTFLNNPSEGNIRGLINYARINILTDREILLLANGLANSGKKIYLKNEHEVCDIASTGGPSSLSTLICPLFLVNLGMTVLKLGVPGRPAGGVDVLAQIKDYNLSPNMKQITSWIENCNYAHILANETFAPLDALLFKFRKENNGIAIPSLAIASLLAKKIATNLNKVGLDVRVSNFSNFGTNWPDAKLNAGRFNRIASLAGIKSTCFLTNGNMPQQPYIGRGEAILALNCLFTNKMDDLLKSHANICLKMASLVSEKKVENLHSEQIKDIFFDNILAQGGSRHAFEKVAYNTGKAHMYSVKAVQSGYLNIDLEDIRNAIVNVQKQVKHDFSDPCGIILQSTSNEYLNKGDVICTFRCADEYFVNFENSLKGAFKFVEEPIIYNEFEEII